MEILSPAQMPDGCINSPHPRHQIPWTKKGGTPSSADLPRLSKKKGSFSCSGVSIKLWGGHIHFWSHPTVACRPWRTGKAFSQWMLTPPHLVFFRHSSYEHEYKCMHTNSIFLSFSMHSRMPACSREVSCTCVGTNNHLHVFSQVPLWTHE